MITKDSIIAFFKKVWNVIKMVWRKIIEFASILLDLNELALAIDEKGSKIFNKYYKVAVKDGNYVVECICKSNGDIVDYENHSQIVQGNKVDSETETKFENSNGLIKVQM